MVTVRDLARQLSFDNTYGLLAFAGDLLPEPMADTAYVPADVVRQIWEAVYTVNEDEWRAELGAKVADGVALLGGVCPGWRSRVDVSILEMSEPGACVLGQVFGRYGYGLERLGLEAGAAHGFTDHKYRWLLLRELWIEQINDHGAVETVIAS